MNTELSPILKETCTNLRVTEKNWIKYRNHSIIIASIALAILIIAANFFPEGKKIQDVPQVSIPVAIVVVGLLAATSKRVTKAQKNKIILSGYNLYTLNAYKAYLLLKKIENEPDFGYVESAKSKLESVANTLDLYWGPIDTFNPSFRSLKKPIVDFIKIMSSNFISAFTDVYDDNQKIDKSKISKRLETIVRLIELFQSENFSEILHVTQKLKGYVPLEKPKKKSSVQKIKENVKLTKVIVGILGSIGIIFVGMGISYLLTLHPESTYQDFVNWSLTIIVPSIIGFIVYIIMWKYTE